MPAFDPKLLFEKQFTAAREWHVAQSKDFFNRAYGHGLPNAAYQGVTPNPGA